MPVLTPLDPRDGGVLCDECDCLELATHRLNLHRRATAFEGQHYVTGQLYCREHLAKLVSEASE